MPLAVDFDVDIEEVDSDGDLVMITEATADSPAIVWVNEIEG